MSFVGELSTCARPKVSGLVGNRLADPGGVLDRDRTNRVDESKVVRVAVGSVLVAQGLPGVVRELGGRAAEGRVEGRAVRELEVVRRVVADEDRGGPVGVIIGAGSVEAG